MKHTSFRLELATWFFIAASAHGQEPVPPTFEDHYFNSAGVRIRYIDGGPRDGEPVVLIHGFTQRIETAWVDTGVVDALDDDYRVIALDWRGHGKSDTPHVPAMYGPPAAEDVIRLLDHLEIEKAHVVGHSMGGHITFRLLADHPERLLSAMPCSDPGVHIPDEFAAVSERAVEALKTAGSIRPLVDYFAAPGSLTEEQANAIVEAQCESNDVKALAALLPRYRALDADPAKLAACRVPCLALIAEHDPLRDGAIQTAAQMTTLEVKVIRDHDHITIIQSPEFIDAVQSFLAAQGETVDQFFDSAGVRIRYIDVGPRDGEPVVLIHGGLSSIEGQWEPSGLIDALDDEYRVIALDLRGHGKSDKPHVPEAYGAEIAADVIRLLDHLELDRAHIMGYSMGGHITFKMLAEYPERFLTALPCGDSGQPAEGAFARVLEETVITLEASGSVKPVLDHFISAGSMTDEEVVALDELLRAANDANAMAAMFRNWQGMDADAAKLRRNTVPSFAIIGADDPLRTGLEATVASMPNLEVEVVDGHDHMTAHTTPEFVSAIKAFLDEHSAPADHYFDSAGVRIRYIDVGPRDGEPVMLIHGGGASVEWQFGETGLIDALDDEYRVIGLDLRGHGKSDKPHANNAYGNEMVLDVIRLLDHLKIEKAHVVGYSLGGRITYRLVADHPERVISAMPCGTDAEPFPDEVRQLLAESARLLETTGNARLMLERFNTDGSLTEAELDRMAEEFVASNDLAAVAAGLRTMPDLPPDPAKLKSNAVPCLCVIGENDPNLPGVRLTVEHMANLKISVLPGMNHITASQSPEFIAAVQAFLAAHATGAGDDSEE